MVEPGALELLAGANGTALITTTKNSGAMARKDFVIKTPRDLALAFETDDHRRTIAVVLNGPYDSAFTAPPEGANMAGHLKQTRGLAGPVFVIADVDWLFDPFSLQQSNVGGQVVVRPLNDNLAFMLNIIEYASGEQALIAIRSRGKIKRPFIRVAELFQTAERQFQERELELGQQVAEIESRIEQYLKAADTSGTVTTPRQIEKELEKFRMELLPARRELRSVRRQIRNEVDQLGRRLTFINIIAGPILVSLWGIGVMVWRRRRRHIG